jgi:DNA (cytosine-5)-methyltransferase 1
MKVVDLYSGAGGMSLGLTQAGFEVVAAVEIDKIASLTYKSNFGGSHHICDDVANLPDSFYEKFKGVDLVVGGPPCQGFSICASNRRQENDERNRHPLVFIDAVKRLKPKGFIIENVPQIKTYKLKDKKLLIDQIIEELSSENYSVEVLELNASNFGVPQNRSRVFIVGSTKNKSIHEELKKFEHQGVPLTVLDAINDLPAVVPNKTTDETVLTYKQDTENHYQSSLRDIVAPIKNHVPMRHTKRLIERFSSIPIGKNGASVWDEHPAKKRNAKDGESGTKFEQNHRRMDPNKPSPTITAYCYSTFLHPNQHRNLTVREFARIQSFPDSFIFYGPRTSLSKKLLIKKGLEDQIGLNQVNQVGNAVPPRMAKIIGTAIQEIIK